MVTNDYRGLPKGGVRPVLEKICGNFQNGRQEGGSKLASARHCATDNSGQSLSTRAIDESYRARISTSAGIGGTILRASS